MSTNRIQRNSIKKNRWKSTAAARVRLVTSQPMRKDRRLRMFCEQSSGMHPSGCTDRTANRLLTWSMHSPKMATNRELRPWLQKHDARERDKTEAMQEENSIHKCIRSFL